MWKRQKITWISTALFSSIIFITLRLRHSLPHTQTHTCINNHPFFARQAVMHVSVSHPVFLRLTSWWGIVHFFCWDSFVKEMSHFLDIRAVKEILYHSCHHHLADFTGFSGAPQTLLLSFAYRGSYNSSFSQSLTPRQTTVLHFSSITYTVCVKHVDQLESRSLSLRDAACLLPLRSNLSIINVWSDRRDQPRRHT